MKKLAKINIKRLNEEKPDLYEEVKTQRVLMEQLSEKKPCRSDEWQMSAKSENKQVDSASKWSLIR